MARSEKANDIAHREYTDSVLAYIVEGLAAERAPHICHAADVEPYDNIKPGAQKKKLLEEADRAARTDGRDIVRKLLALIQ